jgi:hypothetical protein
MSIELGKPLGDALGGQSTVLASDGAPNSALVHQVGAQMPIASADTGPAGNPSIFNTGAMAVGVGIESVASVANPAPTVTAPTATGPT